MPTLKKPFALQRMKLATNFKLNAQELKNQQFLIILLSVNVRLIRKVKIYVLLRTLVKEGDDGKG